MIDEVAWYDELRETDPVAYDEQDRVWYATRYADVFALLVDARLAARVVDREAVGLSPEDADDYWTVMRFIDRWPVFSDPPRHSSLRAQLRPLFAKPVTAGVVAVIRAQIRERCAGVRPETLLTDLIRPACEAGLGTMLGVEPDVFANLSRWSTAILAAGAPRAYDPVVGRRAVEALDELTGFASAQCQPAAAGWPGRVGRALQDGELELPDVVAMYAQLITGTLEPTAVALLMLLEALSTQPALRNGQGPRPGDMADEAVRLATPFHLAPRRALVDLELHDRKIPAGDRVDLVLAAANRDPRRFPLPTRFQPGPDRSGHLAFGRGRHACLGAQLVLNAIVAALEVLADEGVLDALPPLQVKWDVTIGSRVPGEISPATW